MLAATANVLRTIDEADAAAALGAVIEHRPDVVALQEWGRPRRHLLRVHPEYRWVTAPYGENAVGVRADRFRPLERRLPVLAGCSWADRGVRSLPVVPPRAALLVRLRDLRLERDVSVVVFHLVPGVQRAGRYREDRPRLVARHRREVGRLAALVERELARGAVTFALGDSNFDGLELPGLVSAWEGRRDDPRGTLGSSRKIDDVFGPGPAEEITLLRNASDHAALLVRRAQ